MNNRGRGRGRGRKDAVSPSHHDNDDNDDANRNLNGDMNNYRPNYNDENDDDDDDNNGNNEGDNDLSLVSLLFVDKKLGFACYKELTNEIICDVCEANLESMDDALYNIKSFCAPTLFLLHPNIISNSHLLQMVLADSNNNPQAYRYKAMKTSAWNADSALDMMQSKLIIKDSDNRKIRGQKGQKNYLKLAAMIDLGNPILRQAVGSLMTFMQSTVFHLDAGLIYISNISTLPVTSYMHLDSSSVQALQIFSEEKHPNVIKGLGRSKEGFSVFSLFDKTKSLPGRERLKNWMKLPFYDIGRIKQRQNGVSLVLRQENRDFISEINKYMRHIHDIPRLLLRIKKAEAKCNDWIKLYTSLNAAIPIIELMISFLSDDNKNEQDKMYIDNMLGILGTQEGFHAIITIFDKLKVSIDFDASQNIGEILIACGYDQQLDIYRRTYDSLEFQLTEAAHRVLEMIPLLETVSVEYIPQIGYLIAVREDDTHFLAQYERHSNTMNSNQQNDQNDEYLDFSYSQGGFSYYKHQIVLEMDDSIGDITNLISDRQKNLLRMVEEQLLDGESSLQDISIVLGSLDAIISLGTIAFEYNFVKPEIVDDNVLVIKGGRHPLQCISVNNFVPNDTFLNHTNNIAVITGPNSSGKSVYIKQVGLLVYLAHIGSFLPVEKAIIGITDKILTRITSQESVSSPQSAFTLDLCQMSNIIRTRTPRTLCLIDEFGKGTSPVDGISLLAASIKHFIHHKSKVFFVVHFTEVLHKDIIDCTVEESIRSYRMEMLKDTQGTNDLSEIEATPLYTLKLGIAPSSEGIQCARAAGMRDSILLRASNIKEAMINKLPVRPIQRQSNHSTTLVKLFLQTTDWNVQQEDANEDDLQNLKSLISRLS